MDDVADADQVAFAEGLQRGREYGEMQGWMQGQEQGWRKGVATGHELGYMLGVVYALKGEAARNSEMLTSKQLRIAEEVEDLIEKLPVEVEGTEAQEHLLKVRNKFKLLAASVPIVQKKKELLLEHGAAASTK